ncbi:MAG: transglycosylase domain-containing protein, partial [Marinomonas sp.]
MRAQGAGKRGSRRKAAANNGRRGSGGGSRKSSKSAKEPSTFWRWFKRLFFWGTALTLIGLLFVAVSVGFAAQSIPNFHDLKATKNAQTIVVRARDGSEIVEIGPSYGEWLSHDEIPKNMTNAMVAVEDRRFHSHFGIDPIRLTGAIVEGITGARSRLGGTST